MTTQPAARPLRSRRSNLAVPGSSTKMIDKARGLPTDQVFLDLEDAVAPLAKPDARRNIVAALNEGGWGDRIRTVRVNDWTTQWTYADVVGGRRGRRCRTSTAIMLPKVQTPEQVRRPRPAADPDREGHGLDVGAIGIEAQIENALGLTNVTPSRPPRRAWRRSSSAPPTSWPRST